MGGAEGATPNLYILYTHMLSIYHIAQVRSAVQVLQCQTTGSLSDGIEGLISHDMRHLKVLSASMLDSNRRTLN